MPALTTLFIAGLLPELKIDVLPH